MSDKTLDDIEQIVVLVQIDGNCHQVLLTNQNKELLKHFIANMEDRFRVSEELMPVVFENKIKKENPND